MPSSEALLNDPSVRVARPEVPVATRADNDMLRAVEIAILPYFTLPVDQQPIAKMVRGYADAAQIDDLSDNDLAIIRNRLTELQRNRDRALGKVDPPLDAAASTALANPRATPAPPTPADDDAVTMASPNPDASATTVVSADTERLAGAVTPPADDPAPDSTNDTDTASSPPPAPPTPPATTGPAFVGEYDAIGILIASTVHTGVNQPKLLRLMDPTGRRTVAYLEPTDQTDTVRYMGQLVGIVGQAVYDPTTKLNLIRPTQIDVLAPR